MRLKGKKLRLICLIFAALTFILFLFGCSKAEYKIGVVTGSLYGGYSREKYPEAEISEFKNFADVLFALKLGKIDGTMLDRPNFNAVKRTEKGLECTLVPEYKVEIGFGFQQSAKGIKLQSQMNELLKKQKESGNLDILLDKWYGETEPEGDINLPFDSLSGERLRISIDTTRKPFVYRYNGEPVGFEMEILYLFCKEYGYEFEYEDLSFAEGLAGLKGEDSRYVMVCGGLYMTDERKQSVNFSDPYMEADVVMAKYNGSKVGFFESLSDNFDKTFVREGRWKLILQGLGTTLLISLSAVVGGTVLGFLLYLAARSKNKVVSAIARGFAKVYSTIIAGLPTLVVLMLLFYVVFGSTDLSGTVVAIIGFILTFCSFVYDRLKLAVEGVDTGQTEAAYALGYGRNRTFFRIILPQAMKSFAPAYSAEIVSLVKATSVVGYIAVSDLTKAGDIIRSNTFEAFFPLIAIALIYFLITWGISALLGLIFKLTDPRRKKKAKKAKKVKKLPEKEV